MRQDHFTMQASRQDGTYPRPQLLRDQWVSLDGAWDFAYDDDDLGLEQAWFDARNADRFPLSIEVPFVPESEASGIRDPGFHTIVWYRRTLQLSRPASGSSHRHLVHFGAVDHSAHVWVDGQLVAMHVGGQTAFAVDVTDALNTGDEHTLVVRAYDDAQDFEQPRGKQDWQLEPHAIWYDRSTGIWRSVWMETVDRSHIERVDWSSDRVTGTVHGTVILARKPAAATDLRVVVSAGPSTGSGSGPSTGSGGGPSTGSGNGTGSGPSTGSGDGPSTGSGDGTGSGPSTGSGDGPSTGSGDGPSTGSGNGTSSGPSTGSGPSTSSGSDGREVLAELTLRVTGVRTEFSIQLPALINEQAREEYVWTPERPHLIDAELTLSRDGQVVDAVASYLGIRSTTVGKGQFLLNGHPVYVRSVLEQGYWKQSHLTAPSAEALREEVELILALGFNAARVHQKVADPRFLYWADRLGLMIWGETAAAYAFSPKAVQLLTAEWTAIVEQCRNHPSIVTWVPANESWGVVDLAVTAAERDYLQALASVTRALDPTRPVISNDGWEHVDSDILSLHDYTSDAAVLEARYASPTAIDAEISGPGHHGRQAMVTPGQRQKFDAGLAPLMITEFGGTSYAGEGNTWGYTVVDSDDAYRAHLDGLFSAVRACVGIVGFCYTQLTDTLQEANGLLTEDRVPKLPMATLREIVTGD